MSLFSKKPPARPTSVAPHTPPLLIKGFDCVLPDPTFVAQEGDAGGYSPARKGKHLPHIPAEDSLPFVNLPAKLIELTKHCWKPAARTAGGQRGPVTIGASLSPNSPSFPFSPGRALAGPKETNGYVKQVTPLEDGRGTDMLFAQDWKSTNEFTRVNAYTFRGEKATRGPREVEADGGFHPPISRTDQYYVDGVIFNTFRSYMKRRFGTDLTKAEFDRAYAQTAVTPHDRLVLASYCSWRALVEVESHHIDQMIESQTLKNYISTSKYVDMAKEFASFGGWVYVTRVRGGFDTTTGTTWGKKRPWEQEIAFPGSLPWDDVVGFRQISNERKKFIGPIYLRQGFKSRNPAAYQEVYQVLSGKRQG